MNKNYITLLIVSFLIFICMKFLFSFVWESYAVNGVLLLSASVIFIFLGVPFIVGIVTGVILTKYFSISNSDDEVKVVGGGVVGCSFISSVCFSGACAPLAVFGSLTSVLYVIPVLLGIKFASVLNI